MGPGRAHVCARGPLTVRAAQRRRRTGVTPWPAGAPPAPGDLPRRQVAVQRVDVITQPRLQPHASCSSCSRSDPVEEFGRLRARETGSCRPVPRDAAVIRPWPARRRLPQQHPPGRRPIRLGDWHTAAPGPATGPHELGLANTLLGSYCPQGNALPPAPAGVDPAPAAIRTVALPWTAFGAPGSRGPRRGVFRNRPGGRQTTRSRGAQGRGAGFFSGFEGGAAVRSAAGVTGVKHEGRGLCGGIGGGVR